MFNNNNNIKVCARRSVNNDFYATRSGETRLLLTPLRWRRAVSLQNQGLPLFPLEVGSRENFSSIINIILLLLLFT